MSIIETPPPAPHVGDTPRAASALSDSDIQASAIVTLGAFGSKALSALEHIDFLVSIRQESFKVIFDFWQSTGWWMTALFAGA
jgi:hypothetical protein